MFRFDKLEYVAGSYSLYKKFIYAAPGALIVVKSSKGF